MKWNYSKAGVDLDKHRTMHSEARKLMEGLFRELNVELRHDAFTTWIKVGNKKLVLHADGVGTKSLLAYKYQQYRVIGWDCVAMNVNDVACDGAIPLAMVDYIALETSSTEVFSEIIKGIIDAARTSRTLLIGGETAIMPDVIRGVDVVCFVLALKDEEFINAAQPYDAVIGIESNGLHANGYTLARHIIESTVGYNSIVDGINILKELLKPTYIYSNFLLEIIQQRLINSATHITGGAFTKIKRVLNSKLDIHVIAPSPQKIFDLLKTLGNVETREMYRVFNMGIGLIITCPNKNAEQVLDIAHKHGFTGYILGKVIPGNGRIIIDTAYGDRIEF